jgi:hypothetical protein
VGRQPVYLSHVDVGRRDPEARDGRTGTRVPDLGSRSELDQLGDAFNSIAMTLQTRAEPALPRRKPDSPKSSWR